jgi:hypothetical protein
MIGLLLALVLQDALIPEGSEIITGPFFDGKNIRFVARDTATGTKTVYIGKQVIDYLKVVVITDNKTGLDTVTGYDKVFNPVFVDGQLISFEATRGKTQFVIVKGERFELAEGANVLDRKGAMYVLPRGSKQFVVGEKYKGPDCDGIDGLRVSPDGKSAIYKAKIGPDEGLVADGRKIVGLQFWEWGFTPSGEPYYLSSTKMKDGGLGELTLTFAGKKGPPLKGSIGEAKWAPDGRTPILKMYNAVDGRSKPYFVFQNKLLPEFDEVDSPVVSPDGKSLAYRAKIGQSSHVIVNDRRGGAFAEIGPITWSADSKKVAYAGKTGTTWSAVDNDKKTGEWDRVAWVGLHPKSGQMTYVGVKGGDSFLVAGETPGAPFKAIGTPRYAPDGALWFDAHDGTAYLLFRGSEVVTKSEGPILYLGHGAWKIQEQGKSRIVFADSKSEPFEEVSNVLADGKHLVYVAKTQFRQFVYIGRRAVQEADHIYDVKLIDEGRKVQIFWRVGSELHVTKVPMDAPKEK